MPSQNPFETAEYTSTNPFEDSHNQIQADVPLTDHSGKAEVGQEYTSYTQYGDNQSSVYQTTGAPNAAEDPNLAAKAAELRRREEELAAREREMQATQAEADRIRTQGKNNFPKFYPLIYMYAAYSIVTMPNCPSCFHQQGPLSMKLKHGDPVLNVLLHVPWQIGPSQPKSQRHIRRQLMFCTTCG